MNIVPIFPYAVTPTDKAMTITADEPNVEGVPHVYRVDIEGATHVPNRPNDGYLWFNHNGDKSGLTDAALLSILIDRAEKGRAALDVSLPSADGPAGMHFRDLQSLRYLQTLRQAAEALAKMLEGAE